MTRMTTTMSNGQGQSVSYCLLKLGIWRKMFVGCIRTALELFMIEEFNKKWAYFTLSTYTTHTHSKHLSVSVSHLVGSNRSRFACLACAFINTLCLESAELGVRRPPIKTPFGQNNNWNKEWHIFFFSTRLFVCFGDFRLRIVPGAAKVRESKSVKSGCRYVLCWGGGLCRHFLAAVPA